MNYHRKPIAFNVWYKYTPGPVFTDENKNPVDDEIDKFDIYAIIYEPKDGKVLDGSIQFDDECIIAIARVDDPQPSNTYKELTLPFEYRKKSRMRIGKNFPTGSIIQQLCFRPVVRELTLEVR